MKTVMLVDDVAISNFMMKKMLGKVAPEFDVIEFTSPEQAINSIKESSPDLIFLDLNMPHIDGWKFLSLMNENNLDHKVYILTSSTNQLDIQQSKQYKNVIGFLVKPLNLKSLPDALKVMD